MTKFRAVRFIMLIAAAFRTDNDGRLDEAWQPLLALGS
jgi:hypothetical protein